jgi:Concanavalin A-like lectin/glucanases superfamily
MNKLFLHHRYLDVPAKDLSGSGNDGTAHDLVPGTGSVGGAAHLNGVTSWVEVPYASNMNDLGQFYGRVVFRVDAAAAARRLNLVEGFTSFALVINADRSVSFTIVDRNGQWRGCTSAAGLISHDVWHTVAAGHDGVSEARIAVDAEVVARAPDVLGPVRSVGHLGIAIGRWPDAASYQFQGYLSEVALYKFDPAPGINFVFGASCIDRAAVDAFLRRLVERMGEKGALEWSRALQDVLHQTSQAVQLGAGDIDANRRRIASLIVALGNRDSAAFEAPFDEYSRSVWAAINTAQHADARESFVDLIRKLALTDDEWRDLARALCFDRLIPEQHTGPNESERKHV